LMASTSETVINMLASKGDSGDPMAVPLTCGRIFPGVRRRWS
jgi:hypothetical protein